MGVDNVIEAYHIVTRYLLVVSFTHHAHDSYHICPNSFRIGIHQLTLTLKMFECRYHECISSFTIKSGAVHITYPVFMVSFFLPSLPQCKQCGNIIPLQPYNFHGHFPMVAYHLIEIYMPL